MNPHEPLIGGAVGWCADGPSPFSAERPWPNREDRRRLPAAIRLLSLASPPPSMEEGPCFSAVRYLTRPMMRRTIHKARPTSKNNAQTRRMLMWLFLHDHGTAWWKSWWGWRSPREFKGWRALELKIQAPHLEPFELAQLRLPDDISMDFDVLALQAWCQGVTARWMEKLEPDLGLGDVMPALKSGLAKVHGSPWIQMMLAAQHLQPVGFVFPGRSFSTTILRMDAILRDPYSATDGELEILLQSYNFKLAYAKSAVIRRPGNYLSPAGPWYADNNPRVLGPFFHRGGSHTARLEEMSGEEAETV